MIWLIQWMCVCTRTILWCRANQTYSTLIWKPELSFLPILCSTNDNSGQKLLKVIYSILIIIIIHISKTIYISKTLMKDFKNNNKRKLEIYQNNSSDLLYTRSRLKRERLIWLDLSLWNGRAFFSLFVYYRPPGGGRFLCYGYKNIIWFTADLYLFIRKKILCNVTIPAGTQRWINVEFRFRRVIQRRLNIKSTW